MARFRFSRIDRQAERNAIAALWLLVIFCLAGAPANAKRKKDKNPPLKEWVEGPVLYLISREEERAFKRLEADNDRALFIERFWKRRDPDPETLSNGYRKLFWERVVEANSRFIDSPKPGWKTDRGKVHILYGPPTRIEDDLHLRTPEGTGLIRWVYEGRPSQRRDLDPLVIVPFVRDGTGEYRLSYDPELSSPFFNKGTYTDPDYRTSRRWVEFHGTARRTRLSTMLDLGKMQEVPPEAEVIFEKVDTLEAYQTEPLPVSIHRMEHPEKDGVLLSLTVDLSSFSQRPTSLLARLEPTNLQGPTRLIGEASFRVQEVGDHRLGQSRIVIDPGEYLLTLMAVDLGRETTGMHRTRIAIPYPTRTMHLSDVALAEALVPVRYQSQINYDEPFYAGPFKLYPRTDDILHPGDAVKLFYEVYGGTGPFTVTYQLEGREVDGSWKLLGPPSTGEQPVPSLGWELQTAASWPEGQYRIAISVTDAEGRIASKTVDFRLAAAAAEAVQVTEPEAPSP